MRQFKILDGMKLLPQKKKKNFKIVFMQTLGHKEKNNARE